MRDPIVEEVRRIRDAHARRFNYDLHAIFGDIKRGERERGAKLVDLSKKRPVKPHKPSVAKKGAGRAA